MNQNTSGPQGPSGPQGIIIPLVRKAYPHLIANEILGIQPMSDPAGEVFRRRDWRQRLHHWWQGFYWKHMAGTTIVIPWPDEKSQELREYLNENVGKFGRDWHWWRLWDSTTLVPQLNGQVKIKFRWGRGKWATSVLLKWS